VSGLGRRLPVKFELLDRCLASYDVGDIFYLESSNNEDDLGFFANMDDKRTFFVAMDIVASVASGVAKGSFGVIEMIRGRRQPIRVGTKKRKRISHAGALEARTSTRERRCGRCRKCFKLAGPVSGGALRIGGDKVSGLDLGPRHVVLTGALCGVPALNHISESDLGLFGEGRELEIMLFNCRERGLILKEEPLVLDCTHLTCKLVMKTSFVVFCLLVLVQTSISSDTLFCAKSPCVR
jgi:hypothetical protein